MVHDAKNDDAESAMILKRTAGKPVKSTHPHTHTLSFSRMKCT